MNDYYLKFDSEDSFITVLQNISIKDSKGNIKFKNKYAFYVIGDMKGAEGWHVNLRILDDSELPEAFKKYIVTPKTPYQIW